ncbi:MAG: alpha/beta hydrolase [Eubacteriales bacterium]|nr:alpha/beta hydrolase [Eubacteriales bacterium]
MMQQRLRIGGIPAILWGRPSDRVYIHVHGKLSRKEYAEAFATLAEERGYQTLSFDLPRHGEREMEATPCDIWHGVEDLRLIGAYVFPRWREVSLFACSLGACFSLHAWQDQPFRRCLFQSPIVDMDWLIRQMMGWFGVTEERLRREREISTPIDTLSWDYWQYVLEHPVVRWDTPTAILYAGRDNLQSEEVIRGFAETHGCRLTIAKDSAHPFMGEGDGAIVRRWLAENL